MIVLGLHFGHDCGCAVFRDGHLELVVEAERVFDVKHPGGVEPALHVAAVALSWLDIDPGAVSAVFVTDHKGLDRDPAVQAELHGGRLAKRIGDMGEARAHWGLNGIDLAADCPVYLVCHSVAHFAGGVYMAGYDSCCSLVYDGYGTCCGTMAYDYRDGRLRCLEPWRDTFLIGLRYSMFGAYLREIGEKTDLLDMAGKVMGLHAYGKIDPALTDHFKAAFRRTDYHEYFSVLGKNVHPYEDFIRMSPWHPPGLSFGYLTTDDPGHLAIVASMQEAMCQVVEEAVPRLLEETGQRALLVSGGCGLNIVVNDRLARLPGLTDLFVPPNCDDRGLALGAAVIGDSALTGEPLHHPRTPVPVKRNPYQGAPFIVDADLDAWAGRRTPLPARDPASAEWVAAALAEGRIVGLLVPERGEVGPRALGRRSLLASAGYPGMKDIINTRIKRREWWRPFAPVCRAEDIDTYFDVPRPDPYMILGGVVRHDYREALAAVTHVDGTARVQCLTDRGTNPVLWDLLEATKRRTGIGVLLNTSFNLGGRPMVNTTKAMLEFIERTEIDGVWHGDAYLTRGIS